MATTNFYDLLNDMLSSEEELRVLPALRQDSLIFSELQTPEHVEHLITSKDFLQANHVPGHFALAAVYPELVKNEGGSEKLSTAYLERIMTAFEAFKQNNQSPDTLETAVDVALALIEKRKIASHWKAVLSEIFRSHFSKNEIELAACWKTPVMIASQLDAHKDEIFETLVQSDSAQVQQMIFVHCVLSLPAAVSEKVKLLTDALNNQPETRQINVLTLLQNQAGAALAENTAKAFLASRKESFPSSPNTAEVWAKPMEFLNLVTRYQNMGTIAQLAHEDETAFEFIQAAENTLGKFQTGLSLQKVAILSQTDKKEQGSTLAAEIVKDNPADVDVLSELMLALEPGSGGQWLDETRHQDIPAAGFLQAKSIEAAGNLPLARDAAANAFKVLMKNPAAFSLSGQPRFAHNFRLGDLFDTLVHYDLVEEAAVIARKLLNDNPSDLTLMQKSAPVFYQTGDFSQALDLYQTLELLDPASIETKRSKALSLEALDKDEPAFLAWKSFVQLGGGSSEEDLLHLARSANRIGNVRTAIEAASEISETSPNYGKALIILGKSYRRLGDTDEAIHFFSKAIETEVDEPEPWLALAELYSANGEAARAIDTLRAAKSVFPDSKDISFTLATHLLRQNSPSEALTVLSELTAKNPDYLAGQVLTVKTMKSLNHEATDEKIDELARLFPGSGEVNYLKGQQYLKAGLRDEAKEVLFKAVSNAEPAAEWLVAYADALAGEDYQTVGQRKLLSPAEGKAAKEALEQSGLANSDLLAASLKGEMLMADGNAAEAYRVLSDIEAKQVSTDTEWYWRLQAGFARAATTLGKLDVALAAIQEAIGQRPALAGLRQILAEIHKASGDTLAAVEAANQVLVIAPNVVENVLWFSNFLSSLGRQSDAEKELQKAISEKPDEIKYRLALAGLLANAGKNTELEGTLGSAETLIQANPTEEDLMTAAGLYWSIGNLESTAALLENRVQKFPESWQAQLDFAGILAQNHEADRADEVLARIQPAGSPFTPALLINAEVAYEKSNFEGAESLITNLTEFTIQGSSTHQSQFLPEPWNLVLGEKYPLHYLQSKISFARGEFEKTFELCKKWILLEPDNAYACFYLSQAKLALGLDRSKIKGEAIDRAPGAVLYAYAQDTLDSGDVNLALKMIEKAAGMDSDKEWEGALRSQAAAVRGELIEADVNASDFDLASLEGSKYVKAEDVAKQRSRIKANLALWHWKDALELAANLYKTSSSDLENVSIYLKSIVMAVETAQHTAGLWIKAHALCAEWLEPGKEDFQTIQAAHENTKATGVSHWLLRGKLAFEPEQANVRALALLTPEPGDIVAMMSALHALGQDGTAVQIAQKFENQPSVLNMLAMCQSKNDINAALGTLGRSLQAVEGQPEIWVSKSVLEEQLGEKENAIQSMENALSYWPDEAEWHIRAANLWQAAGDVKKAVDHLQIASGLEQQSAEIQFNIGSAYISLGKNADAIAMLELASSNDMNRSDILEALADACYQAGDLEKSVKIAERASLADPFSVKPTLLTGEIELEKGNLAKALEQARLAISKNEKSADAILFLAKVLLKKGDKTQALAALEKAANSEDATLDLMLKHAHLVREIKGSSNSKVIFEGLVKRYPQNVELLKLLAESQLDCAEKVAAEETARHSLRLDANQPEVHHFLGKLKFENGNLDQAVYHFSREIALDNQMVDGYLELAKVYQKQRDFHHALETLQQAIQAAPHDARTYVAAANMLREAKDYASAETMLRKAALIDPNDVNIKRQLGAVIALNLVHKSQQASSQL